MIVLRHRHKHYIIFDQTSHSGPGMRPERSGIDQGRRFLEDRILQHTSIIDADIFFRNTDTHQPEFDGLLHLGRGRQIFPDIGFDANDIFRLYNLPPAFNRVVLAKQFHHRIIKHTLNNLAVDRAAVTDNILMPDQDNL